MRFDFRESVWNGGFCGTPWTISQKAFVETKSGMLLPKARLYQVAHGTSFPRPRPRIIIGHADLSRQQCHDSAVKDGCGRGVALSDRMLLQRLIGAVYRSRHTKSKCWDSAGTFIK